MRKIFYTEKHTHSEVVYQMISKVKDLRKRNLLRGYSAKSSITSNEAEVLRRGASLHDSMIIGGVLRSKCGLIDGASKEKKSSSDIFRTITMSPLEWRAELSYTAGYVNAMEDAALDMLGIMKRLISLDGMSSEQGLNLLLELSREYGASNYLSYKLAYLRSSRELPSSLVDLVSDIEEEIGHRENIGLHFSAIENLSSNISLFVVARRRVSGLVGRVNGDFRKALSLSNFIPTPLSLQDLSGFLLRATESCLLDTIYAILIVLNLAEDFEAVQKEFYKILSPRVISLYKEIMDEAANAQDPHFLEEKNDISSQDGDPTLDLYRASAAFLERPKFARFRNNLDKVIGIRLISEITAGTIDVPKALEIEKGLLLSPNGVDLKEYFPLKLDVFYRTYLFLSYIRNRYNIVGLTSDEIRFIFDNTLGLETLLSEEEMRTIYVTAHPSMKSLVAVLALALFRKKSIDPDIDFEFRTDFIQHVNAVHQGSVVRFIDHLLVDSPQIASYIVGSLDEVTLEKLYTLVENASQASEIRGDILRLVGQKLNRIEYIIEADAINTRAKVATLQQYFDSSRMYVDSVSMKKWLDSNPTVSTEQYRTLQPRIEAGIASIKTGSSGESSLILIKLNDQSEYLVSQIAKDAFEQFCLNTEFGIQSYLGRRIRHNTLDGVTTDTVDAVLRKPEYRAVLANANMRRTVEAWMDSYKSIVDKLRRDFLQFKSPSSLFSAVLVLEDSTTKENIRVLTNTLRAAGSSELLNELVIAFCWKQISPQLENAARFIRTTLLKEANATIDKYFSGYFGAVESQIKAELHEAVNEVFKKVSDWFRIPRTGFISASPRELCQIILIDLKSQNKVDFIGDALDIKYTGISVHRLYDCLAVLLQNAHKHGEEGGEVTVNVTAVRESMDVILDYVSIDIASTVSEIKYKSSRSRILTAIEAAEAGSDMVTEGYTGIKKIKFITRVSEGLHTMRCQVNDDSRTLILGFSIHAEMATDDSVGSGMA